MKYIDKSAQNIFPRLRTWEAYHHTTLQNLCTTIPAVTGKEMWQYLDDNKTIDGTANNPYSKEELKQSLIEEQGHICCYCGQAIENDNWSVIEHLNPKTANLCKTYDYTNLLASCDGGMQYKIHRVVQGETLATIATDYGVTVESLEEIWVQMPISEHIKKLTQCYNIDDLKVGDRLFIIPKVPLKEQHCDNSKGSTPITRQPIQAGIETFFHYLPNGKIDVSKDTDLEKTVEILGLNKSPLLVEKRKQIIAAAQQKRSRILMKYGIAQFRAKIAQYCNTYNTKNASGKLKPFAFVTISVLSK